MDGTDINACDRTPIVPGTQLFPEQSEDNRWPPLDPQHTKFDKAAFVVSARDDGQIHLYNFPVVIDNAPGHGFRGHSSHVAKVKFTSDAQHVISCGGMDRTTFQWKTHGIREPSSQYRAERGLRATQIARHQTQHRESTKMKHTMHAAAAFGGPSSKSAGARPKKPSRSSTARKSRGLAPNPCFVSAPAL
jgi:hypothetical protein